MTDGVAWHGRGVSLLCLLVACASTPAPRNPFSQTEAAPTKGAAPAPDPSGMSAPRELTESVALLASSPDDLVPSLLGRALRQLANNLRPLSSSSAAGVERIAERLEAAPARSLAHAALAQQGLNQALEALLEQRSPSGREGEYRRAVRALDQATNGIQKVAPLNEQRAAIAAAFRAATDAVLLALGEEPAFQTRVTPPTREPLPVELEVERARSTVLAMARAKWSGEREEASRALTALAELVTAADSSHALEDQVKELRFQAKRLSRADTSSLGDAAWVKRGLGVALSALDRVSGKGARSSSWSQAAGLAVETIDERSTINLQCAAIQDAFRATIDAFAAELTAEVR